MGFVFTVPQTSNAEFYTNSYTFFGTNNTVNYYYINIVV